MQLTPTHVSVPSSCCSSNLPTVVAACEGGGVRAAVCGRRCERVVGAARPCPVLARPRRETAVAERRAVDRLELDVVRQWAVRVVRTRRRTRHMVSRQCSWLLWPARVHDGGRVTVPLGVPQSEVDPAVHPIPPLPFRAASRPIRTRSGDSLASWDWARSPCPCMRKLPRPAGPRRSRLWSWGSRSPAARAARTASWRCRSPRSTS